MNTENTDASTCRAEPSRAQQVYAALAVSQAQHARNSDDFKRAEATARARLVQENEAILKDKSDFVIQCLVGGWLVETSEYQQALAACQDSFRLLAEQQAFIEALKTGGGFWR